jgi:hypothetical protein
MGGVLKVLGDARSRAPHKCALLVRSIVTVKAQSIDKYQQSQNHRSVLIHSRNWCSRIRSGKSTPEHFGTTASVYFSS